MFNLFNIENPRLKKITDCYIEITNSKNKEKDYFMENLFILLQNITVYLKDPEPKNPFSKGFAMKLDSVFDYLIKNKEYLHDDNLTVFFDFMKSLVSIKISLGYELENLFNIMEFLNNFNEDQNIQNIYYQFFHNPIWIKEIVKSKYIGKVSSTFENPSFILRNRGIIRGLSESIKNYDKKHVNSLITTISCLSERIPRDLRYDFSNLLYSIFALNDEYFELFKSRNGYNMLLKIFKQDYRNISNDEIGYELSDFGGIFRYKAFTNFLYESIINEETEDFDNAPISAQDLIYKYSYKIACLKLLSNVFDQVDVDSFALTRDQILKLGNIRLLSCNNGSLFNKIERNKKLGQLKQHFSLTFINLLSRSRKTIWSTDSGIIDEYVLQNFWNKEDGFNYFINIRNPSFLEYHSQFFDKFNNWDEIFDRMNNCPALCTLFTSIFSLTKVDQLQSEDIVKYLNNIYGIYEKRKDLFDNIIKRIIRFGFSHFMFVLKNSPNNEIFNEVTVLSFQDCYSKYDISLYSVFLKFSLQFNPKMLEADNFERMLGIYHVYPESTESKSSKKPSSDDLAYLALLLFDKNVMQSDVISLASNIISIYSSTFDNKSCADRLSFRILQMLDFDLNNAFKIMSSFQPSTHTIPLYLSINPNSTYLNEQFLCTENKNFDYFTALNIVPRSFVSRLVFQGNLIQNLNSSILVAVLQTWALIYDYQDIDNSFNAYNAIHQKIMKNFNDNDNNNQDNPLDILLLILCLFHFDKSLQNDDEYMKLLGFFLSDLKNYPNKGFWFSLLLSSNQLTSEFVPLPFLGKYSLNEEDKSYFDSKISFDNYEIKKTTKMTLPCLVPFSNFNYLIQEQSSTKEEDITFNSVKKETIDPNNSVINDENTEYNFHNFISFIGSLLVLSKKVDSKRYEEDKRNHYDKQMVQVSLISSLANALFINNEYKYKITTDFLRWIFFGNPYEEFTEIQNTLQIFVELFTLKNVFNQLIFDFLLDCAIDGWFCEKIGAVLNSLFKYYNQFKTKASKKMITAYKIGFYSISLKEAHIFLCLMDEFETLFFSIFSKEDYFFYYNRITELQRNAESCKENNENDLDYSSLIKKCKNTINLLNKKYHEIILKFKLFFKKAFSLSNFNISSKAGNESETANAITEIIEEEEENLDSDNELKEIAKEEQGNDKEGNQGLLEENKANENKKPEDPNESAEEINADKDDDNQTENTEENPNEKSESAENAEGETNTELYNENENKKVAIQFPSIESSSISSSIDDAKYSDADEEDFSNYDEEKYNKKLIDEIITHQNLMSNFRIEAKKQFDEKASSLMSFVYNEVRSAEMIAENYRKIWFDSDKFDANLLLRKAEYEFEDVLKDRVDLKESVLNNKDFLFTTIQILTGIKNATKIQDENHYDDIFNVKLNGVDGLCFFTESKIVFVEGLNENGEFHINEANLDDENYAKISINSHRYEGHALIEILMKDTSNISINNNNLEFVYSDIPVLIEVPFENEERLSKLFNQK